MDNTEKLICENEHLKTAIKNIKELIKFPNHRFSLSTLHKLVDIALENVVK